MKIGHGSNLRLKGLRNLEIEEALFVEFYPVLNRQYTLNSSFDIRHTIGGAAP